MKIYIFLMITIIFHCNQSYSNGMKIVKLKGQVRYQLSGATAWKNAFKNVELKDGDRVKTSNSSFVKLKQGESSVLIKSNSELILENIESKEKSIMSLAKGFIWASVKPKEKKEFKILTKSAAMGVRGTKFAVDASTAGSLGCVCEGSIEVNKGKINQIVQKWEGIEVTVDGKIKKKSYKEMIVKNSSNSEFSQLARHDKRYQNCLSCHQSTEHKKVKKNDDDEDYN